MKSTYLKLFLGLQEIPNFDNPNLKQYRIDPEYLSKVAKRISFGFGISDDDMSDIIQGFNEMCLEKRVRNINHSYCILGMVQGCKKFLRDKRELSYDDQNENFKKEFGWIESLLNND
jgi:hypothetical protein